MQHFISIAWLLSGNNSSTGITTISAGTLTLTAVAGSGTPYDT